MSQPFWRENLPAIGIGLINVFVIGLGGSIPVFAVLLGFAVGWWVVRAGIAGVSSGSDIPREVLRSLALAGAGLAGVSFLVLLVLWGPSASIAFDPAVDAAEWGVPLILYTSQASKVGWLLLMTVVSPVLQFMAVMTGGVLRLAIRSRRSDGSL